MLNKLDIKNYDNVVKKFNFEELITQEKPIDIANILNNKVRFLGF